MPWFINFTVASNSLFNSVNLSFEASFVAGVINSARLVVLGSLMFSGASLRASAFSKFFKTESIKPIAFCCNFLDSPVLNCLAASNCIMINRLNIVVVIRAVSSGELKSILPIK